MKIIEDEKDLIPIKLSFEFYNFLQSNITDSNKINSNKLSVPIKTYLKGLPDTFPVNFRRIFCGRSKNGRRQIRDYPVIRVTSRTRVLWRIWRRKMELHFNDRKNGAAILTQKKNVDNYLWQMKFENMGTKMHLGGGWGIKHKTPF